MPETQTPGLFGDGAAWGAKVQAKCLAYMLGYTDGTTHTPAEAYAAQGPNPIIKVSESTLRRWHEHYLWWGETPAQTRLNKRCLRAGALTANAVSMDVQNYIKTQLTASPHLYLDEVRDRVAAAGHGRWSISTIHHIITHPHRLKWSLTTITLKAMQANLYEQMVYKAALSTIEDPAMLVFVDESSVGNKSSRRRRGWSPRGTQPYGHEFFTGTDATSSSTYTLIAAADINGFVEEACQVVWRKNASSTNSARGTVDAAFFTEWCRVMLVPTLGNFARGEPRSVVVLDNARVHNPEAVEALITGAGATVIWTAAYSPELNPIERCFAIYKAWIRRYRSYFGQDVVQRHLVALQESVTRKTMVGFMGGEALEGCIRNLPEVGVAAARQKQRREEELVVLMSCGLLGPVRMMRESKRRRKR
jgi:hypothetical protein